MKTAFERSFIRSGRKRELLLKDELIGLRPREYYGGLSRLGGANRLCLILSTAIQAKPLVRLLCA